MNEINRVITSIGNFITWLLTFWQHGFTKISGYDILVVPGVLTWATLVTFILLIIKFIKKQKVKKENEKGQKPRKINGWDE